MRKITDEYLEDRLDEWADWSLRIEDNGLGYPRRTIEARLRDEGGVLISGTGCRPLPVHEKAEEMERFIVELYKHKDVLGKALRTQYLEVGTVKYKAKKANTSLSQFKVYVKMAKTWLAGRLSGQ